MGLGQAVRKAAFMAELVREVFDRPFSRLPESSAFDGEYWADEGPDDLWPEEPVLPSLPEVITNNQWGLKLPSGDVCWNMWQGTHLNNPIDRLQAVAKLQEAALSCGFGPDQLVEFLGKYSWVTRTQMATVFYEDTGAYSLTDSQASAMGTPDGEPLHDGSNRSPAEDPGTQDSVDGVCTGPVGGDAQ